ncbi:Hypothetical predicted protein [Cloeon dipterum]|uniref:Protein kinase C-binding protein 1 n=1 Tax=Cloeon dipterum TaxID=197152 RepID=A0A8S1DR51_9INSE|nr:Hypothetical predicted protein [Cloeon dipterum]
MSDVAESTEKADSESRCSTPRAASIASVDLDESSKLDRRTRSSRSNTPVTKGLRPKRQKVSNSPSSSQDHDDDEDVNPIEEGPLVAKRKNAVEGEAVHDPYCWICHKELTEGNIKPCSTCLRSFHPKCAPPIKYPDRQASPNKWECPECSPFSFEPKPRSEGTQEQLNVLFKYVIDRAVTPPTEPFMHTVNMKEFPQYLDYIIHPVCISEIEEKVKNSLYRSPRELLADFKWICHNSIIFNSAQAKLTTIAKQMLRVVREETKEIESCPNCLFNAYTMKPDWFIQACDRPHLLVWAKMKGFPYWPAKAMSFNQGGTLVDVRFFGKHDRAYLPIVDCMLYTAWYPAPAQVKKPREDVAACIKEVDQHIAKLKERYGSYVFASNITFLNPKDMEGQVKKMLPNYNPDEVGKPIVQKTPAENAQKSNLSQPSVVLKRMSSIDSQVSQSSHSSTGGEAKTDSISNYIKVKPAIELICPISASESPQSSSAKSDDERKGQGQLKRKLSLTTSEMNPNFNLNFRRLIAASITESSKQRARKGSKIELSVPIQTAASKLKAKEKTSGSESDRESGNPVIKAAANLVKELKTLNSDLSDLDDEVDPLVEHEDGASPAKKVKSVITLDEDAEMLRHEAEDFNQSLKGTTEKSAKGIKSPQSKRKIAEGIKVLKNLKIFGLDVTPLPSAATSPLSPSYEISSDSSEFIESDLEFDKQETQKEEPVVVMEVEPDIHIEKTLTKKAPQRPAGMAIKGPFKNIPQKTVPVTTKTVKSTVLPVSPPQTSLLKKNLVPNKARKSLTTAGLAPQSSFLSQRLTAPATAIKKLPVVPQQQKFILLTTQAPIQVEKKDSKPENQNHSTVPSAAGPAIAKLNSLADNLADNIRQTVYTLINDLAQKSAEEDLKTENAQLKLQLEAERWYHRTTIEEMKRNHELVLQDFEMTIEQSTMKAKMEMQKISEAEMKQTIDEVKRKTWCTVCLNEGTLYCCWNTSYCGFPCQRKHWTEHKRTCKAKSVNMPKVSEFGNTHHNGPALAQSTKNNKINYTAAAGSMSNQTNGTVAKNARKVISFTPQHPVLGSTPDVTAAVPQMITLSKTVLSAENFEPNVHVMVGSGSNNTQAKLAPTIHHNTLPSTITSRPVHTMAKNSTPATQVTTTPLFQFYKESTE